MKVYDWIDANMNKQRICDITIDLESVSSRQQSVISSEPQETEFKPLCIELQSWPSDASSIEH
jgi:hypothetical protein